MKRQFSCVTSGSSDVGTRKFGVLRPVCSWICLILSYRYMGALVMIAGCALLLITVTAGIVAIISGGLFFLFADVLHRRKSGYYTRFHPDGTPKYIRREPELSRQGLNLRAPSNSMGHIPEIGRDVRGCCYQTARIQEQYCVCGRAVDAKLLKYFS